MAENVVSNIFEDKKILEDNYPQLKGVKTFDLHKKHLFYGRIDDDGDAIYLDDSNIKQIESGASTTHLAVDFVCKAFSDLRKNLRSAANKGYFPKNGVYPANMIVHRSWKKGNLEENYNRHLNNLYTEFVDSYLSLDRRAQKVKNFRDFVREFIKFSLRTIKYFPVTKTGFITSAQCSPYTSGLMIEIANERHGPGIRDKIEAYTLDANRDVNAEFLFFVNEVKKFGFMVDKNAPWRLVFNLASGQKNKQEDPQNLKGGQLYMDQFAASFENVFKTYYRKAYLDELNNLRNQMYSLYQSFYLQFSTYESIKYITDDAGNCQSTKVFTERKDREPLGLFSAIAADMTGVEDVYELQNREIEYWLKVILKLRMAESDTPHDIHKFKFTIKEIIQQFRLFDTEAALKKINDLTKGFHVTNFIVRGDYWYGLTEEQYQERKLKAEHEMNNPSLVQYSLVGTGNTR